MPWLEWEPLELSAPETGLMPSPTAVGGVRRLPTLAGTLVLTVGAGRELVTMVEEKGWNFERLASGGGGSSKFGRLEALGLRAVKLGGAPNISGPECMWAG